MHHPFSTIGPHSVAALLLACAMVPGCTRGDRAMNELAPDRIKQWTVSGKDRLFDRQTIFELLNGGAEVYLHFGMKRVLAREYERPGAPSLSLLVFDMASASDAYGIFSHERAGPSAGVGQDSDHEAGLLRFWRGRYFVSVTHYKDTKPAREAARELGRAVASRIRKAGERPRLVGQLPAEGLDAASVRYLRSAVVLPMAVPELAGVDLGLGKGAEVAVGRYSGGGAVAVLIKLADAAAAKDALKRLIEAASLDGKVQARVCGAELLAALGKEAPGAALLETMASANRRCADGT